MKKTLAATGLLALGMAFAIPAFAQGPAKTPNGSMPNVPSSSTPQSGSSSGSPIPGAGSQNDNGGQAMAPRGRMGRSTMGRSTMGKSRMSRRTATRRMRHNRRAM